MAVLATVVLGLVVAACGRTTPADTIGGPGPSLVEPTCPQAGALLGPGGTSTPRSAVPDGFVTAWVMRCRTEVRDLPGKGKWTVQLAERADTDAADLVTQLRKPSDPKTTGACSLELVTPPYFLLVGASGKAILPAVPTDGCGKPRREATAPLDTLPFHPLSETPVNQVQRQESVDSGCAQSWKDLIVIDAARVQPAAARPLWPAPVTALRICVYDQISAGELPVGRLAGSRTLSGAAAKTLVTILDGVAPSATCPAPHTRFAALTADGQSAWATAELDGCRRLLRPDNTLGQLTDPAIATLVG